MNGQMVMPCDGKRICYDDFLVHSSSYAINENAQVEFSRTDTQVVSFLIVLVVMCNNCQ